jgi:hypothetical protein
MIRWFKRLTQPRAKSEAGIVAAMLAAQAKEFATNLEVARLKRALRKWGGYDA